MAKAKIDSERRYTLTVTERQLSVISKACEVLARLHMGQLSSIAFDVFFGIKPSDRFCQLRDELQKLEPLAKGSDNTGMRPNDESSTSWDVYQVARHKLAWDRHPEGGMTVDFHDPMRTSTEPLAIVGDADSAEIAPPKQLPAKGRPAKTLEF